MHSSTSKKALVRHRTIQYLPGYSTTCLLAIILFSLLIILQVLLVFQRSVEVRSGQLHDVLQQKTDGVHAALVTLADPSFQGCVLQLVKSARQQKWQQPIFLLAINYNKFEPSVMKSLAQLGVFIVHTNPYFDSWLQQLPKRRKAFRSLDYRKFRKMELFLNPIFRTYERLIYVDPDGIISSSLQPLLIFKFPVGTKIAFRQNDEAVGKETLWGNEIAQNFLSTKQRRLLNSKYPDRWMTGASCWFIVETQMLASPENIFRKSVDILCALQSSFKLNDQTLLNLLFYDNMSIFPWCVWDELYFPQGESAMRDFCRKHMHLQRWIKGGLKFMYRHMSVVEKKKCIRGSNNMKFDGQTYNEQLTLALTGRVSTPMRSFSTNSKFRRKCDPSLHRHLDSLLRN